jgi:hypothetical protein
MTPETYISTATRTARGRMVYRVALKHFSGNLNSLDRTLDERLCRSEAAARRVIAEWQKAGIVKVQGVLAP